MFHEPHTVLDLHATRVAELRAEAAAYRLASDTRRRNRGDRWWSRLQRALGRGQPRGRSQSGSRTPVLP
jgi:hypothetical protein